MLTTATMNVAQLREKVFVTIFLATLVFAYFIRRTCAAHDNVPIVGTPAGIFGPWKAPYLWVSGSQKFIQEGVLKYGDFGKPFKVRSLQRWMVFITNPTVLDEIRTLPVSVMSSRAALDGMVHSKYLFFERIMGEAWHIEFIRRNLTEKLNKVMPEIFNEIVVAWEENTSIGAGDGWTKLSAYQVMLKIISRATNRVYVGIPLCRNEEYLDSLINFAVDIIFDMMILDLTPKFLRPLVNLLLCRRNKTLVIVMKHVGPIFEERRQQINDGKWKNSDQAKPNDVFQWILEAAPPGTSIHDMTMSLIFLNVASLHTTSITLIHVLFDLAANPSYQTPLRDEIEEQLRAAGGLTKQALTNMKKMDSVLRESARMAGANLMNIIYKVMSDHTFSDGTKVAKGSWVMAPTSGIHRSEKLYTAPNIFNGYRFSDMRKVEGNATRFQNVSTSLQFVAWGHGQNACPGRFFATNELKAILCYLLCNYEFKFEHGTSRPGNKFWNLNCFPDTSVSLLFKNRDDRGDSILSLGNV